MRGLIAVVIVAGCGSKHAGPDAGIVTLEIKLMGINSEVTGNGIACGTDPAGCSNGMPTSNLTACSVDLPSGTQVSLSVLHPVCPPNGGYFAFAWTSPPCPMLSNRSCAFEITSSQTITVAGVEAIH